MVVEGSDRPLGTVLGSGRWGLVGRWTLRLLWKEQGGICPVCNQKITTVTGWHNHHIVWRTHGGKDTIENRVLVHPNCHQQIHSQGLDVGKPRPAKGVREARSA